MIFLFGLSSFKLVDEGFDYAGLNSAGLDREDVNKIG